MAKILNRRCAQCSGSRTCALKRYSDPVPKKAFVLFVAEQLMKTPLPPKARELIAACFSLEEQKDLVKSVRIADTAYKNLWHRSVMTDVDHALLADTTPEEFVEFSTRLALKLHQRFCSLRAACIPMYGKWFSSIRLDENIKDHEICEFDHEARITSEEFLQKPEKSSKIAMPSIHTLKMQECSIGIEEQYLELADLKVNRIPSFKISPIVMDFLSLREGDLTTSLMPLPRAELRSRVGVTVDNVTVKIAMETLERKEASGQSRLPAPEVSVTHVSPRRLDSPLKITVIYKSGFRSSAVMRFSNSGGYAIIEPQDASLAYLLIDGATAERIITNKIFILSIEKFERVVHCPKNNELVEQWLAA